ncbi:MAG: MATE family efflux transporter [Duodenibacillus sp.]|nr:MATE family efflux transporter [Duodenibacillus sp.]
MTDSPDRSGAPGSGAATTDVTPERAAAPAISLAAIARLASPIFVANIAVMGSATIDTVMAGRLGAEHLAAVAVGGATVVTVLVSLMGLLQALSPIAGHHYGAGRLERIGFELAQCGWLAAAMALLATALLLQTDVWLAFTKSEGSLGELVRQFLVLSALGFLPAAGSRCFVALNAAVSRPQVTMWVSLAQLAAKAPLNAAFMYGWLGLPAMGAPGAALATAISHWAAFLAYYLVWRRSRFYDAMRASRFYGPDPKALANHLRLGLPIGGSTFFEVSSFTLMAMLVARIGTIEVAAHQIVANITATLYMVPLSIGIAASVLVSQCLGAGRPDLARRATLRTLACATAIACVSSALLYLLRHWLVGLYTPDAAVTSLAASIIIFGSVYHVTDACQTVSGFALRGYRVTLAPMAVYGVFLWAVGVGGGYWLAFAGEAAGGPYGIYGFWAATAAGLVMAGVALLAMALAVSRRRAAAG